MVNPSGISVILGVLELASLGTDLNVKLMEIAKTLHRQRQFDAVIYASHDSVESCLTDLNEDNFLRLLQQHLEVPMFHLNGNVSFNLWPYYNRELLAIMTLNGNEMEDKCLLLKLWLSLGHNRNIRIILLAKADESDEYQRKILQYCVNNAAINVIAFKVSLINDDMQRVYKPKIFPNFSMISMQFRISPQFEFYQDHVKNMQGYPIRVALAKHSPRAYVVKLKNGNTIIGGFAGHFITEFVRNRNATLVIPHSDQVHVTALHMKEQTIFDKYDISAEPLRTNESHRDSHKSPAYLTISCCLMAPASKILPAYLYYVIIFDATFALLVVSTSASFALTLALIKWIEEDKSICWKNGILNIYVLNGLLGQSFRMEPDYRGLRSMIYIVISVGGLIFNTTYVTYLQSFNATPPTEKPIRSVSDIKKYGMQYATYKDGIDIFAPSEIFESLKEVTKVLDLKQFYELRDNLDTRYLYGISSSSWALYEKQQSFFKKPRFFFSDVCFLRQTALSIYLPLNSTFRDAIDASVGYIHQAGLVEHWMSETFLEGVRMKRFVIRDISEESNFKPMRIQDLQLVMYIFLAMICVMLLCFVGELIWRPQVGP